MPSLRTVLHSKRLSSLTQTGLSCLWLTFGLAASLCGAEPAKPTSPAPTSSAACLECHNDKDLSTRKSGQKVSLFVDEQVTAKSVHRSLECIDCHEKFDADSTPHRKPMVAVDCASCHEDTAKKHAFHPRLANLPLPAGEDTSCTACHGKHDIASVKGAAFAFNDGPQADACGK